MADLFLVTGGAGFIGSHLVERLLADGARVRVLDNFSTGTRVNLPFARAAGRRLEVIRGDLRNRAVVARAARGVRVIFHQAAMRSVPRSVKDPLGANENNVTGTLNVLEAARRGRVARVVYASSSSVYGDRPDLPKHEEQPPAPISPYAVSKAAGEQYAVVWTRLYGVESASAGPRRRASPVGPDADSADGAGPGPPPLDRRGHRHREQRRSAGVWHPTACRRRAGALPRGCVAGTLAAPWRLR